jgi:hypothetical protein
MVLHQILFSVFAIGCCSYALVRGGTVERIGAITNILGSLLSILAVLAIGWGSPNFLLLIVDCSVAAAFFALSASDRFWPIWAFGFSLGSVAAHVAQMLPGRSPLVDHYARSEAIWAWPALAALALGTWSYRRRNGGRSPAR